MQDGRTWEGFFYELHQRAADILLRAGFYLAVFYLAVLVAGATSLTDLLQPEVLLTVLLTFVAFALGGSRRQMNRTMDLLHAVIERLGGMDRKLDLLEAMDRRLDRLESIHQETQRTNQLLAELLHEIRTRFPPPSAAASAP